ncbi:hypothetical protein K439DRAFT_1641831, partial [Ramaria rubella]
MYVALCRPMSLQRRSQLPTARQDAKRAPRLSLRTLMLEHRSFAAGVREHWSLVSNFLVSATCGPHCGSCRLALASQRNFHGKVPFSVVASAMALHLYNGRTDTLDGRLTISARLDQPCNTFASHTLLHSFATTGDRDSTCTLV